MKQGYIALTDSCLLTSRCAMTRPTDSRSEIIWSSSSGVRSLRRFRSSDAGMSEGVPSCITKANLSSTVNRSRAGIPIIPKESQRRHKSGRSITAIHLAPLTSCSIRVGYKTVLSPLHSGQILGLLSFVLFQLKIFIPIVYLFSFAYDNSKKVLNLNIQPGKLLTEGI
jgi:hypothetical protein